MPARSPGSGAAPNGHRASCAIPLSIVFEEWRTKPVEPPASSGVPKRVLVSRAGHKIVFDDADGGGGITIEDVNGNTITLDSRSGAVTIESVGNATIKAGGNLTLQAQGQVELKGTGVTIDGGAATVDVKGSIINLN